VNRQRTAIFRELAAGRLTPTEARWQLAALEREEAAEAKAIVIACLVAGLAVIVVAAIAGLSGCGSQLTEVSGGAGVSIPADYVPARRIYDAGKD
jgi:hypothetical protein